MLFNIKYSILYIIYCIISYHIIYHIIKFSNFPVGLAPQKKAPGTHQICRKTIGKMLLKVDLWGAFFGVANHQENHKLYYIISIYIFIYIYVLTLTFLF